MKQTIRLAGLIVAGWMACVRGPLASAATPAVDPDKEKALANPYANDFGPKEVSVDGYPKDVVSGYKMLLEKCTKCHTSARPLNAQFVELGEAEAKALKASLGKDAGNENLFKIDDGVWKRYVKRMASKPGCELAKTEDQKAIYKFLVYDSKARKTGDSAPAWRKHRQALLDQFKASHPDRYRELYETPTK